MRHFLIIFIFTINFIHAQQTIGLFQNDEASFNGYTLWSIGTYTYLIDNCGYEVNRWESLYHPGLSVYLTDQGTLMRPGSKFGSFNGAGAGGIIEEYSWDGELIWSFDTSDKDYQPHHDIELMPNGNILFIAWELKTNIDAAQAGVIMPRTYWPEVIYEIKKIGVNEAEIVWEWHLWDHIVQDRDTSLANYGIISEELGKMDVNKFVPSLGGPGGGGDWLHFNSIDYDEELDLILISARHSSEILIIDHSTTTEEAASDQGGMRGKGGDFLYRWGNPDAYDRGSLFDQVFYGQHDAKFIRDERYPNGAISVFNNGSGRSGSNYSSIDVIELEMDAEGLFLLGANGIYLPDRLSWQYMSDPQIDFFSNNMAGAQYLDNGNFLICEANKGNFFEVDSSGVRVWHYKNTSSINGPVPQGQSVSLNSVFRAERYAPDFAGFEGKDLMPGAPIELNPIEYECEIFDGTSSLEGDNHFHDVRMEVSLTVMEDRLNIWIDRYSLYDVMIIDMQSRVIAKQRGEFETVTMDVSNTNTGMHVLVVRDLESGLIATKKILLF